jgi:hypothetical protein
MADETERWNRVQRPEGDRGRFQAKASPVALHTDPARRRNLDKEEAARDRLIVRWALLILGILTLLGLLMFILPRLGTGASD